LKFLSLIFFSFSGVLGCSSLGPSNLGLFGVPFNHVREKKGRKDFFDFYFFLIRATMRKGKSDAQTIEYTVNLHKKCHRRTFKKKAPWAVKVIKKFAQDRMGTKVVKIDAGLNKAIWAKGVRNIPRRIRIRIERKRNEEEDAKEKLISYVSHVPCASFKGMVTARVEQD